MKSNLTMCAALFVALPLAAQTTLAPEKQRISDAAISADHRAYESLQGRIQRLNDRGRPIRDYFLSKAQCWLDVSFHEYTRNDRSAFPQAAMTESETLIVGMERGTALSADTALVNNAARLRPDLWERTAALKGHSGWRCAQQLVACAEVELVHAGNEFNQQQWRHAKPYVQIAEEQIADATALAERCDPPPPPPAPPPAPVAPPPVVPPEPRAAPLPPVQQTVAALSVNVVFNFDRSGYRDIRPFSIVQLEELVSRLQRDKLELQAIRLVGHADRLNGTGKGDYNKRLSERRVQTVRDALVKLGVDGGRIQTDARGDVQQISGCEARFKSKADLEECLLPNRRVEVLIDARQR